MLLNSYIIFDYSTIPLKSRLLSDRLKLTLRQPAFLIPKTEYDSGKLYILTETEAASHERWPEYGAVVVSGMPSPSLLSSKLDILYTENPVEIKELFNEISELFSDFSELENTLHMMTYGPDSFQHICDAVLPFLRNPLALYTTSFQIVCFSEKKKRPNERLFMPSDYRAFATDEEVSDLTLHPEFSNSLNYSDPMIFPSDLTGYRILYQNIRVSKQNVARLVICETDSPIRDSDYPITVLASACITASFERQENLLFSNHPKELDHHIDQLLKHNKIAAGELNTVIKQYGWVQKDTYICFKIISQRDLKMGSIFNTCIRLENKIPKSYAMQADNHIIYIVNLTAAALDREDAIEIIVYELREVIMKAGISTEFQDLTELDQYYFQADTALSIGNKQEPQIWSYRFESYALGYARQNMLANMSADCFCHRGLKKLQEYDKKKNRNYSETLRIYLENNMSVSKTIKVLYLQRQTFLYQLKRIQEISNLNLKDYNTRLYLLLSFQMLDSEKKKPSL
ncbi:PucR family transcriptional regulator [Blautia producta]|uniref:PucR family transcriptional regulator n=1 Tax=Blautia producta TaxID=33035 RepID=UPI0031B58526